MKVKFLSLFLILTMCLPLFCACSDYGKGKEESSVQTEENTDKGELSGDPVAIILNPLCENSDLEKYEILIEKGSCPSLPEPKRESYTFKGWYKDADLKVKLGENEVINESTVLFAGWDFHIAIMDILKNPVTVQFITNGGTLSSNENQGFATEAGKTVNMPVPKREDYTFLGWFKNSACTDKYISAPINENLRLFAKWKYKYEQDGMTLPVIAINTADGEDIVTRQTYKACNVTLHGAGNFDFKKAGALIRGRGNSTWTQFEKKSFRLKFNEKTDLLGMGSAKNFLLISNAFDQSILRNYTAYTFAGLFGNKYTTECKFVHLYVNDDYRGLYLVTEHTEQGKHRVDIDDGSSLELDAGYLAEFGGEVDVTGKQSFHIYPVQVGEDVVKWSDSRIGKIMSPDGDICTNEQRDYFEKYVNEVNAAIINHDFAKFSELCDVDSFVDYFVINEILYSGDLGYSFFIYKPKGGKLCMGPLWDYDQSAGNSTHGGVEFDKWETKSKHLWMEHARLMPEFFTLARERYIEQYELIRSLPKLIENEYNTIKSDIDLNYKRWDEIGVPHWRSIEEQVQFTTQWQHVEFYINWIQKRLEWLEAEEQFNITKEDVG